MLLKLNNGFEIPQMAIGTWQLLDENIVFNILDEALELGITHIDTAEFYKNEHTIGKWLANKNRKNFFVTSKVWNDKHDQVIQSCDEILKRLNHSIQILSLVSQISKQI